MRKTNRYVGIGIGVAMTAAAPIAAQSWQAIAVSPGTGQEGYSFGHDSRADAEKAAKEACQNADCEIASSSQQCLLLVEAPGERTFATVVPAGEVKTSALAEICTAKGRQGCTIKRSVCGEQMRAQSILN